MSYKPVDTAIVMVVGPCVDDADFKSLEEAIAYNAAGMDISLIVEKTDGTTAVTAITLTTGGTSDWTHKDGGYYEVEITAAQNAEEGIAYLRGVCTGVLPFESPRYDIEKANIYDSLRKGTDNLQVDVTQLLGTAWLAPGVAGTPDVNTKTATATALDLILKDSTFALAIADAIWDAVLTAATHNVQFSGGKRVREIGAYAIHDGTAQAGAVYSITLASGASAINGTYNRNLLVITGGTGEGQTRAIADYNGTSKVAIIDRDWRTNPDATSEYQITANDTPLIVDHGVAQAGAATTITLRDYASSINNTYVGSIVTILAGAGRGQERLINSYVGSTKVATVCTAWVTNPDSTSVYAVVPYGASRVGCIADEALVQINGEMVDVLKTDTSSEMSQGAPPATPTMEEMIKYLYFALRNKREVTTSEDAVYSDAGAAKLFKAALSDDGSTFTKAEFGSGA